MGRVTSEYMKEYRANNPSYTAENNLQKRARQRAMTKLAALHPKEFQDLMKAEIAAERKKSK